jgi:hypothetical protein
LPIPEPEDSSPPVNDDRVTGCANTRRPLDRSPLQKANDPMKMISTHDQPDGSDTQDTPGDTPSTALAAEQLSVLAAGLDAARRRGEAGR